MRYYSYIYTIIKRNNKNIDSYERKTGIKKKR